MEMYNFSHSGNCYKIRLFASILDLPLRLIDINLVAGEHFEKPFAKLNPFCEMPVLVDGEFILRDSAAIMMYLARRYGGVTWLPTQIKEFSLVAQWFGLAASSITYGPGLARAIELFGYPGHKPSSISMAERVLGALNIHLENRDWLELGRPTIADIAVFPYVAMAPEGGIDETPYPQIQRWINNVETIPGFIPLPTLAEWYTSPFFPHKGNDGSAGEDDNAVQ